MYKILCLNKISPVGTKRLGEAYTFSPEIENPDGILVRSAAMHDMKLGEDLLAIARAGAGVNNIPVDKCLEKGIVVFNTPGANANAVQELVLCALPVSYTHLGVDFQSQVSSAWVEPGSKSSAVCSLR